MKKSSVTFDPDAAAPPHSGIFGLPFTPKQSKVIVIPVPFGATTSYGGGTEKAPAAILAASRQVELHDYELGDFYEHGIAMLPISRVVLAWHRAARKLALPVIRAGGVKGKPRFERNVAQVNRIGTSLNDWLGQQTTRILDEGKIPFILGGDHSVPFGAIEACAWRLPELGILHIDAHCDLRAGFEGFTWSHASIFYNVVQAIPHIEKIVQVGVRDISRQEARLIKSSNGKIVLCHHSTLAQQPSGSHGWHKLVRAIVELLPKLVYLSVDIDGLDPSLCPHTGTPVPGGLSFDQFTSFLDTVVKLGKRIVGGDLCEVSPGPRGDEWDANVGARVLYKMIGYALKSQPELR